MMNALSREVHALDPNLAPLIPIGSRTKLMKSATASD